MTIEAVAARTKAQTMMLPAIVGTSCRMLNHEAEGTCLRTHGFWDAS